MPHVSHWPRFPQRTHHSMSMIFVLPLLHRILWNFKILSLSQMLSYDVCTGRLPSPAGFQQILIRYFCSPQKLSFADCVCAGQRLYTSIQIECENIWTTRNGSLCRSRYHCERTLPDRRNFCRSSFSAFISLHKPRQPIAVSDISVYICLIDIRSHSEANPKNNWMRGEQACLHKLRLWPIPFFLLPCYNFWKQYSTLEQAIGCCKRLKGK